MAEVKQAGSGRLSRFVWGVLPIAIVFLILRAFSTIEDTEPIAIVVVFALCAAVLWFGWSWIRRSLATKWFGILLSIYLGLVIALYVLGYFFGALISVAHSVLPLIAIVFFPLFLIALPFVIYDLFFRAPREGSGTRAASGRGRD